MGMWSKLSGYHEVIMDDVVMHQERVCEMKRVMAFLMIILCLAAFVAGCSCGGNRDKKGDSGAITGASTSAGSSSTGTSSSTRGSGGEKRAISVIRVGYFPNLTHAQAMIGAARGDFAAALNAYAATDDAIPDDIKIEFTVFNAGPSAVEALLANAIDLIYVGPNPSVNGFIRSKGQALQVVAGCCSGGAVMVVRPDSGITCAAILHGKHLATPQLGNTQDVALRHYLASNGLKTTEQGGSVRLTPIANPDILALFRRGEIDGAWVPEPWGARLIIEGGGEIFINETEQWPGGQFCTALVAVNRQFADRYPELVKVWLKTHVELTLWVRENPDAAKAIVNSEIARLTGNHLPQDVLDSAFERLTITYDPLPHTLEEMAQRAYSMGFLGDTEPNLTGYCNLEILNEILRERDLPPIEP